MGVTADAAIWRSLARLRIDWIRRVRARDDQSCTCIIGNDVAGSELLERLGLRANLLADGLACTGVTGIRTRPGQGSLGHVICGSYDRAALLTRARCSTRRRNRRDDDQRDQPHRHSPRQDTVTFPFGSSHDATWQLAKGDTQPHVDVVLHSMGVGMHS